ncbi:uncharacterized protein LOC135489457 [Lineus longissimus]|uniref:uncharacterized protein LOC135489457 n=1 Tax=Lineus longissimus TaxID=88925 RepID=UPI00315DC9E9
MKILGSKSPFGVHDRAYDDSRMLDPLQIETADCNEKSKMPKSPPRQDIDWYYNTRVAIIVGVSQIICGLLCILLGSAAVAVNASHSKIAAGIWGGLIIVAAGCLAIWSSRAKTHKSVLICFVTSFLAGLSSCLIFIVAGFGISDDLKHVNDTSYFFYFERSSGGSTGFPVLRYNQQIIRASIAVHGLIITVAMFELVASTVQAVLCKYNQWCNRKDSAGRPCRGELAVIYETEDNKPLKSKAPHFISREQTRDITYYHVDESSQFQDYPRPYSDEPEYSDSKIDYSSSSELSATHGRTRRCDRSSVFTEPDMEPVGTRAMNRHQEALLRNSLAQQ